MDLIMRVELSEDEELTDAFRDYEKAKSRLIRCLEKERLVVKEKTASDKTDTAE